MAARPKEAPTEAQRKRVRRGEAEQGSGWGFPRQRETEQSGLCDDEIGCQGYYEYLAGNTAGWDLNAKAVLDISKG